MHEQPPTLEVLGVLFVDESGQVTTVIQNHVEGLSAGESSQGLLDTPVVLLLGLALPCEDRNAGGGNAVSTWRLNI